MLVICRSRMLLREFIRLAVALSLARRFKEAEALRRKTLTTDAFRELGHWRQWFTVHRPFRSSLTEIVSPSGSA